MVVCGMGRTADYTIKGFIYQFNKTLLQLLKSNSDEQIQVEGYIEDIDIFTRDNKKGIQCKYYESSSGYTSNMILKPILQMMATFSEKSQLYKYDINFELYIYYNGCEEDVPINITTDLINNLLNTHNKECIVNFFPKIYQISNPIIKKISLKPKKSKDDKKKIIEYFDNVDRKKLKFKLNIDDFVSRTRIAYGEPYDRLCDSVKQSLMCLGHTSIDVNELFYPNAIQKIASISILHDDKQRIINKETFCSKLFASKKLLLTRWNREIITREAYVKRKRKELAIQLQNNSRDRVLIFHSNYIKNFYNEIISLIVDYVQRYYQKPKLQKIPLFVIKTENCDEVNKLEAKLYERNVRFINGIIAGDLHIEELMADVKLYPTSKLRLCRYCKDIEDYIIKHRVDDIFVFGDPDDDNLKKFQFNFENICVDNIEDIKKILKLRGVV